MKTGNTLTCARGVADDVVASMEPGHEDREYRPVLGRGRSNWTASMEPGHEDREYAIAAVARVAGAMPQWSPVMKTGNTRRMGARPRRSRRASMEPGHEDREYGAPRMPPTRTPPKASMEPGHEDREYAKAACYSQKKNWPQWSPVMKTGNTSGVTPDRSYMSGLNGARS